MFTETDDRNRLSSINFSLAENKEKRRKPLLLAESICLHLVSACRRHNACFIVIISTIFLIFIILMYIITMFAILIIYLSFFSGKSYSAFLYLLEQHIAKRKHETGFELLSSYPPDFFPLQTFNHISEMCTCTYFSLFVLRNAERDDDGGFYCSISTQLHSYCFFEPVCETMDSRKFNFSPKLITLLERTGS